MQVIDFRPEHAAAIAQYASRGASAQPLAEGAGEAHAKGRDSGCTAIMIQIAALPS